MSKKLLSRRGNEDKLIVFHVIKSHIILAHDIRASAIHNFFCVSPLFNGAIILYFFT